MVRVRSLPQPHQNTPIGVPYLLDICALSRVVGGVIKTYALPPVTADPNAVFKNPRSEKNIQSRIKKVRLGKTKVLAPMAPVDLHQTNIHVISRTPEDGVTAGKKSARKH